MNKVLENGQNKLGKLLEFDGRLKKDVFLFESGKDSGIVTP